MRIAFNKGHDLLALKASLSYPDFEVMINGEAIDWNNDSESKRRPYQEKAYVLRIGFDFIEVEDDIVEGIIKFDYKEMRISEDFNCEISEFVCYILLEEVMDSLRSSKTSCIYKITNLINNKAYIGKTNNNPAKRWATHILGTENSEISKAIFNFGVNNFEFKVVEVIAIPPNLTTQSEIDEFVVSVERKWIIKENSIKDGYNGRM